MKSNLVTKIIETERLNLQDIFTTNGKIFTFLNPVSYLVAYRNKSLYKNFDGIFSDGSLLVLAIKLFYGSSVTRRSFDMTSIAPLLMEYAEKNNKTIYIVASKQEQVEKAKVIFHSQYANIKIIGFRNGYFLNKEEIDEEAKKIKELSPDFLIVGMGALFQEKFLLRVKELGFRGIGFTCGGFIHQISENKIEYYPKWVDKTNLRFLYRIYKEKHTRKRYTQAACIFPFVFMYDRFFSSH